MDLAGVELVASPGPGIFLLAQKSAFPKLADEGALARRFQRRCEVFPLPHIGRGSMSCLACE